jgi:hypothetical protein
VLSCREVDFLPIHYFVADFCFQILLYICCRGSEDLYGLFVVIIGKIDDILFSDIRQPRLKEAAQFLDEVDSILNGGQAHGTAYNFYLVLWIRIRIRIGSGFIGVPGSGIVIRIQIQEGKYDPQT